jgi:hypothetical protein
MINTFETSGTSSLPLPQLVCLAIWARSFITRCPIPTIQCSSSKSGSRSVMVLFLDPTPSGHGLRCFTACECSFIAVCITPTTLPSFHFSLQVRREGYCSAESRLVHAISCICPDSQSCSRPFGTSLLWITGLSESRTQALSIAMTTVPASCARATAECMTRKPISWTISIAKRTSRCCMSFANLSLTFWLATLIAMVYQLSCGMF